MSNKVDLIIAANDQASAILKNISASLAALGASAQATIAKLSAVSQSTAFASGMNGMTQSVQGFGAAATTAVGQNNALGNSLGALSGKQTNVLASTNALTSSGKGLEAANRGMATAFQQTGTATDATSLKIRDLQAKLVVMSQSYQQAATGTAVYGKSTADLEQKKRTLAASLAVAQEALQRATDGGKASQAELEQRKAKIAGLETELLKYSNTQQQVTIKGKEDEAQLARRGVAIDKVKAQLAQLTAETQKSESVMNAQANVSKNVAAAFDSLGTKAGQVATAIGKMALAAGAAGLVALGAGLKTSVTAAADFETTLNRFSSVAGTSLREAGLNVADFSDLALKMGADTQFSAAEAATAMVELAKGGIDPVTIKSEGLKAALDLAAAGELKLADASGIVAKQLGVWSSAGVTATQITNLMAQAANASTVDVAELQLGLSQVGGVAKFAGASFQDTVTTMALIAPGFGSASDAGTSLKAVLNNLIPTTDNAASAMQDLGLYGFDQTRALKFLADAGVKPLSNSFGDINAAIYDYGVSVKQIDPKSKNAQKQFDKLRESLGLMKSAFYDSSGQFVGMEKAAQLLGDATKNLSAEQRLLAFETIFGSDGQRAAALIAEKSREGYIGMAKAMSLAGDAASQAAERNKGFNFALETMKGSIETVAIIIGSKLIPIGTRIVNEFITPAINAFGDFAKEMFAAGDPIQFLLDKIGGFSPVLLNVVTSVSALASGLITTLSPAITFIVDNFGTIATVVGVVAAAFGGLSIISGIVGTVTAAVTAIGALGGVMATISTIAGAVVAALGGPLVLAIAGVALAAGALYLAWQTNFGGIRDTVAEYMPQIEGLLSGIGAIINEAVIPALVFLWNRIQEVFAGIVAFLSAHSAEIQTVLSAAWAVIGTVISNALTVVKGIVTTVLAVIRGDWQGAWNALSTMLATVASNWASIIGNIFTVIGGIIVVGVQAWVASMVASWTPAIEKVSAIWSAISTAISGFLVSIGTALSGWFAALQASWGVFWASLGIAVSTIFTAIATQISSWVATISATISAWSATISATWTAVWSGLSTIVTEVFTAISVAVQTGIGVVSNAISIASAYISAAWALIWTGLSFAVETALGAVVTVITTWAEFAKNVLLFQIGAVILAWQFAWSQLQPILQPIFDAVSVIITTALTTIQTTITTILTAITTTWTTVWNGLTLIVSSVITGLVAVITPILITIETAITTSWQAISVITTTVFTEVSTAITTIWTAISTTVSGILTALQATISSTWAAISAAVSSALQTMQATISSVMTAINAAITSAWTSISTAVSSALAQIQAKVTAVWNDIKATTISVYQAIQDKIIEVWTQIYTAISTKLNTILNAVKTAFSDMLTAITTAANSILTAITTAFTEMYTTVSTKMQEIYNIIQEKLSGAINAARNFISAAVGIGRDIIGGMIQGIMSKAGEIADAAANVVGKAITAAKNALGIKSPSKEFAYLGDMSAQGYIKSLDSSQSKVTASATNLMQNALQGAGGNIDKALKPVQAAVAQFANALSVSNNDAQISAQFENLVNIVKSVAPKLTNVREIVGYIGDAIKDAGKDSTEFKETVDNLYQSISKSNGGMQTFNNTAKASLSAASQGTSSWAGVVEIAKQQIQKIAEVAGAGPQAMAAANAKIASLSADQVTTWGDLSRYITAASGTIRRAANADFDATHQLGKGATKAMREAVANEWAGLSADITKATADGRSAAKEGFNGLREDVKAAAAGVKTSAAGMFDGIKETITNESTGISELVKTTFKGMSRDTQDTNTDMNRALSATWREISKAVDEQVKEMKASVAGGSQEQKDAMNQQIAELRESVATKWRDMKYDVSDAVKDMKRNVSDEQSQINAFMASSLAEIKNNAKEEWTAAKNEADAAIKALKAQNITDFSEIEAQLALKAQAINDNTTQAYEDLKGQVGQKLADLRGTHDSSWRDILGIVMGVTNDINGSVPTKYGEMGSAIKKILDEIDGANKTTMNSVQTTTKAAMDATTSATKEAMDAITGATTQGSSSAIAASKLLQEATGQNFDELYKSMQSALKSGTKLTDDELSKWMEIARSKAGDLPQHLALSGLEEQIKKSMSAATSAVSAGSGGILAAAKLIADANTQTFDQMYKSMQALITSGAKITDEELAKWLELAKQRAGDLPQVMALNELEVKLRGQMVAITQGLQSPLDEAKIALPAAAVAIADGIQEPIDRLPEAVRPALIRVRGVMSDEMQGAVTTTRNVGPDMYVAGISVMDGLINGMSSKLDQLEELSIRIADTISRTTQQSLGIASPSRVTTWQGKMVGEGWVKGIASMTPSLVNAVSAMSDTMQVDGALNMAYSLKPQAQAEITSPYYVGAKNGNDTSTSQLRPSGNVTVNVSFYGVTDRTARQDATNGILTGLQRAGVTV